ncbi:hypothetical protein RhiJN_08247 [Ceratobasidium sp. AG-Ba]|nr:hypothetical protein RhiJN_08247 [Ceratobasidium sp. AG-Ba]
MGSCPLAIPYLPTASPDSLKLFARDSPYDGHDIDEDSFFQAKLVGYRSQSLKQLQMDAKLHKEVADKYATVITAVVEGAESEDENHPGRKMRLGKDNLHWMKYEQRKAELRLRAVTALISEKENKPSKPSQMWTFDVAM